MPIDVQIRPLLESVDLFGTPDASSAYSLSGHIAITVLPPRSLFESSTRQRYALESLELVFEGQSELISDVTGYSAIRLCNIKRELVQGEPIELAADVADESGHFQPTKWEFIFDMAIPGWLPASTPFRESHHGCQVGTQYTLHATAQLRDASKDEAGGLMTTVLCSLFKPPFLTQTARCPVELKRFFMKSTPLSEDASETSSSGFPTIPYSVSTAVERPSSNKTPAPRTIPMEVLKGIEVRAEAPEHFDLGHSRIPFAIRLRPGKAFPRDAFQRTRIVGFNMDIRQHESYTSAPCPAYRRRFPIPSKSQQPPKLPLLSPHPLREFYELGVVSVPPEKGVLYDVDFSLLPSNSSQSSHRVANGGLHIQKGETISFDIALNLRDELAREGDDISKSSKGDSWKCIRATTETPFLRVRHQILVELICQYQYDDVEDGSSPIAQELLRFALPLHFVIPTAPLTNLSRSSSISLLSTSQGSTESPYGNHTSMKIPAYSQLFYSNGDPRFNEWDLQGELLPAYCKDEDMDGSRIDPASPSTA